MARKVFRNGSLVMEELCILSHSPGIVWRESLWKDSKVPELLVTVKALIYMSNLVNVPKGRSNGTELERADFAGVLAEEVCPYSYRLSAGIQMT